MSRAKEKQYSQARLMKAYKTDGMEGFFKQWEKEHPRSDYPFKGYIEGLVKIAEETDMEKLDSFLATDKRLPKLEEFIIRNTLNKTIEQVISELFMHQGQAVPEAPSHTDEVFGHGQAVRVIMYDLREQYGIVNRAFYKKRGKNRAIPNDNGMQLWYEIDMIVGDQAGHTIEVPAHEVFKNKLK